MDFPKKQAQRLMPLYLLEYSEKLFTNHPDPSAPWGGGGGSDYTAGEGITITNNEISVDTNVIATKSDIPSLDGYATEQWVRDQGYSTFSGSYNDLTNKPDLSIYSEVVDVTNGFPDATKTAEILANPSKYVIHGTTTINNYTYHIFAYYVGVVTTIRHTWMQIIRIPYNNHYILRPYAFGCANDNTWKGPYVYLWKISYSDIYNAPTLATVATSGSYNDLTDKPTLATVATSGSYNDLTDKPTIPTVNNPTITFTQGGATKGTITLNQSGDQTIEFDAGASLPDSPFLNVDDPQDQMFFSLDGSDSSWYKYVDLSATPNRMFHVNLSALNPVFKDGLTSTYNEQTNQLEVSLNAVIPTKTSDLFNDSGYVTSSEVPSSATSTSTSIVTPTTGTFVTGTSTNTANVVNSVTYTPSSETLTFTYEDNTTASFTFLTSSTTVTSDTTSVVTSVTDSTSNAMTGATVSTSTTTTLS